MIPVKKFGGVGAERLRIFCQNPSKNRVEKYNLLPTQDKDAKLDSHLARTVMNGEREQKPTTKRRDSAFGLASGRIISWRAN
jgi:hypothetical protein